MGIQKRYLKSRPVSKVTFRLPKEAAPAADAVHLVGDFNNWDKSSLPMTRLKSGEYKLTLDLPTGRRYHFRYLIQSGQGPVWENDWSADHYVPCGFTGAENSVVEL